MNPTTIVGGSSIGTPTRNELMEAISQKDAEIRSLRTALEGGQHIVTTLQDLLVRVYTNDSVPGELREEIARTCGFSEEFFGAERAAPSELDSLRALRDRAAAVQEKSDKVIRSLDRLGNEQALRADIRDKEVKALLEPGLDVGAFLHLLSVVGFNSTILSFILKNSRKTSVVNLLRERLSYVAAADNTSVALQGVELKGPPDDDLEVLRRDLASSMKEPL